MKSHSSYAISPIINDPVLKLEAFKLEQKISLVSEMIDLAEDLLEARNKLQVYDSPYHMSAFAVVKTESKENTEILTNKFNNLKNMFVNRYGNVFVNEQTNVAEEKPEAWLKGLRKVLMINDEKLQDILVKLERQYTEKQNLSCEEKKSPATSNSDDEEDFHPPRTLGSPESVVQEPEIEGEQPGAALSSQREGLSSVSLFSGSANPKPALQPIWSLPTKVTEMPSL